MISSVITVTTSPTLLVAATAAATRTIYLQNDAADIYIGGSTVTTTTGLTAAKDTQFVLMLPPQCAVYGLAGTGTHTVRVMQPKGDF